MTKKLQIMFADSFFESFEGTQEDLDALVKEIQNMFENKTEEELRAIAIPMDDVEVAEFKEILEQQVTNSKRNLH